MVSNYDDFSGVASETTLVSYSVELEEFIRNLTFQSVLAIGNGNNYDDLWGVASETNLVSSSVELEKFLRNLRLLKTITSSSVHF